MSSLDALWKLLRTAVGVFWDLLTFFRLTFRTPQAVAAENLFLRKQLALYVERKTKPHHATDAVRFTLAQLSRFFEWRDALTIVKPDTLIRRHRKGFRLFWKWKSRPAGRPRVPLEVRKLIGEMAENNPTWGEERIADELLLKIGIQISPRELDSSLRSLGLRVLRTPYRSPQANAFCERLIASARRECLDFVIPLHESHIRMILKPCVAHFNRGRPHSSLGPGIPEPSFPKVPLQNKRQFPV